MHRTHSLALALLLVSACHCGPDDPTDSPPPVSGDDAGTNNPGTDAGTNNPGTDAGQTGDPRVDFLAGLTAARPALRAGATTADLDGDGRNEYTRQLGPDGQVLLEEIDVDGNGTSDLIWDYSGETKTFTADVDGNGIAEKTIEVTSEEGPPDIRHFVVTEDTSGDGIPDTRRRFSIDPSQDVVEVLVEEDPDQDGSYPIAITYTTTRVQTGHLASVSTSGAGACTPDQKAAIDAAFDKAVADGLRCLASLNPSLALQYAKTLADANITISCGTGDSCGYVDTANAADHWFGKDDLPIVIETPGFDPSACGPLESTLFHELSHYVLGLHEVGSGTEDPQDRVYGCEKTCFGAGTSRTCAQCLGTKNGDPRCKRFPEEPCTPPPAYCPCDGKLYPNEADCNVACPSGLTCFTSICKPRGPCR